jgi:hypothetical protein
MHGECPLFGAESSGKKRSFDTYENACRFAWARVSLAGPAGLPPSVSSCVLAGFTLPFALAVEPCI